VDIVSSLGPDGQRRCPISVGMWWLAAAECDDAEHAMAECDDAAGTDTSTMGNKHHHHHCGYENGRGTDELPLVLRDGPVYLECVPTAVRLLQGVTSIMHNDNTSGNIIAQRCSDFAGQQGQHVTGTFLKLFFLQQFFSILF